MTIKLKDLETIYKICSRCGHDHGVSSKNSKPYCWKCGNRLERDYSERAIELTKRRRDFEKKVYKKQH